VSGFSEFAYGILAGVWIAAAVVELTERRKRSTAWPLRVLMGVSATLAFVAYVASGR